MRLWVGLSVRVAVWLLERVVLALRERVEQVAENEHEGENDGEGKAVPEQEAEAEGVREAGGVRVGVADAEVVWVGLALGALGVGDTDGGDGVRVRVRPGEAVLECVCDRQLLRECDSEAVGGLRETVSVVDREGPVGEGVGVYGAERVWVKVWLAVTVGARLLVRVAEGLRLPESEAVAVSVARVVGVAVPVLVGGVSDGVAEGEAEGGV